MTIEQQQRREAAARTDHGERCNGCVTPMADDQRYCLNCGNRRAGLQLPFVDAIERRVRRSLASEAPAPAGSRLSLLSPPPTQRTAALLALGAVFFVLVLGLGVLIGSLGEDAPKQVAAARPQVITVAAPAAASAPAAATEFTSDWPDGKDGFTLQLEALPKEGTDAAAVTSAKSEAQSKGAPAVGALDSDEYSSLDGGNYLVYSGVFDSRKQAAKALRKLRNDFSGAKVIRVSAGGAGDRNALSGKKKEATVGRDQLNELEKLSPDEYQKKARKLPDTTKLPGKAPPKDDKKPGGGGDGGGGGQVIE